MSVLPGLIDWRCHTCGGLAVSGAIHIDLGAVRRAQQDRTAWRQQTAAGGAAGAVWPAGVLLTPRVERWRVDCGSCCHDCSGCYSIEIRQCRTAGALLRWTEHLYGKSWFAATNWVFFAAAAARRSGPVSEPTGVW